MRTFSGALAAALIFTATIRRKVAMSDEARVSPIVRKAVGLVSICLWLSVAMTARLIMLLP